MRHLGSRFFAISCFSILSSSAVGCGPPQAPKDIDSLNHFLYREWPDKDPKPFTDGLNNLVALLTPLDLVHSLDNRSFTITPLIADDLVQVNWPMDRKLADTLGTSVARKSIWPISDHARLQVSTDQLPIEPTAVAYARTFIQPTDPTCFVDHTCLELDTDNDITRSNALLQLEFINHKNFRWVQLSDGAWAFVGRAWIDHSFKGSKGSLLQSYTLDIWLGRPDGTTIRYEALWSETQIGIDVTTGTQLAVIASATDGAIGTSDEVIGKRYHGK